jgi:hypothetical protein
MEQSHFDAMPLEHLYQLDFCLAGSQFSEITVLIAVE